LQWQLQSLGGHDGDEHNTHQNNITIITNAMMILILMVFTYSRSDSKKNLLCWKIILTITKPNINYHSQCDDHIHYYNMSTWIKKSFSRKAHKTNESLKLLLITQWEFINGLKTSTHAVCNSNFIHPSLNGIPFLCNHLRNST
jgi:hypothetical protein